MANSFSKAGITTGNTVEAWHVTQSIDAFSGLEAYEVLLSGSFTLQNGTEGTDKIAVSDATGSIIFTGSYSELTQASSDFYNFTSSYNTGSFTGSFTGNFIGSISSASYAPNFANTNLTFDGGRSHDINGNGLEITTDAGGYNESWYYQDTGEISLGYQSSQFVISDAGVGVPPIISMRTSSIGGDHIFLISGSNPANVVINETGKNVDFRVEGDTDTNLLFTDASTDRVGIGKNTPNTKLDINGNTTITGSLITSGSRVRNYRTITVDETTWSSNPSQILATDDIILVIDNTTTNGAFADGNIGVDDFLSNSPAGRCVEIICIKSGSGGGPTLKGLSNMAGSFLYLNQTSVPNAFLGVCPFPGQSVTLMAYGQTYSGSIWGEGVVNIP